MLKNSAIALAMLLAISSTASAQTDEQHLIIPGQRIGPIILGMSIEAVNSTMGRPVLGRSSGDLEVEYWFPSTHPIESFIVLFYSGPDSVTLGGVIAIGIYQDASYVTREGVHVGSNVEEVRAAFGGPSNVVHGKDYLQKDYELMEYRGRGIAIYVQQKQVFRIFVCRPLTEACSILPPTLGGTRPIHPPHS